MATRVGCSIKVDGPIQRKRNAIYSRGDVYGLKESVYTPIYDILQDPSSNLGNSYAAKRSRQSFTSLTRTPDVIVNPRPAIMMQDQDDDKGGLMVCLATRYEGGDISKLPHIFQHFSIPIAPHEHISPGHLDHLHSHPEWGRSNAWIIARPFPSKATRDCVWAEQIDGEEVPYEFGEDAMGFLTEGCDSRWEDWVDMCKDRKLAAKFEAELREHVKERKDRFYGGAGSRASSRESLATGIDGPSWRSRVRSPTTIPEEPENNVVPGLGAPRKLGEPRPHNFTGNHRTGSTYSFASASGKMADTDKNSIKSSRSRTSLVQKPQDGGRFMNKFNVLRTLNL